MRAPRILTVAVASVILIASTRSPSALEGSASLQRESLRRLSAAWNQLYAGSPREAYRAFAHEFPRWKPLGPSTLGYIDAERGMMVAAILAKDDATAQKEWGTILAAFDEPRADTLYFSGRVDDALRTFRDSTQDNALVNPHVDRPDPNIDAGVRSALKSKWRDAITAWSRPAVGGGTYDLTDEQEALIGIAYAEMGQWTEAEATWIAAARIRRNVPQLAYLYPGNMTSLSMLWHFRNKFLRGENAYVLRINIPRSIAERF